MSFCATPCQPMLRMKSLLLGAKGARGQHYIGAGWPNPRPGRRSKPMTLAGCMSRTCCASVNGATLACGTTAWLCTRAPMLRSRGQTRTMGCVRHQMLVAVDRLTDKTRACQADGARQGTRILTFCISGSSPVAYSEGARGQPRSLNAAVMLQLVGQSRLAGPVWREAPRKLSGHNEVWEACLPLCGTHVIL